MKRTTLALFASMSLMCATSLMADTVESIPFLAVLTPDNEVPPTNVSASANGLVWVHVVRDGSGNITSGTVDFNVSYRFPAATSITGMHIHSGAAGTNGPILIDSSISAANPVVLDANTLRGTIFRQTQFPGSVNPTLATITDLIANPQAYYLNMHTPENPGGVIRSQLVRADFKILMGQMSPDNEVPPVTGMNIAGIPTVTVLRGRDASGAVTSAWVTFNMDYTGFSPDTMFTGFHIHNGPAGVNGPVIINTGIGGGANAVPVTSTGAGNVHYDVPVTAADASFATEVATVNGLFDNPNAYYINIHTTVFPGGVMRSQLRSTDKSEFQVTMATSNEIPPITGLNASAPAKVTLYMLRNADGSIAAGTAIFDVNFRGFPTGTIFTGLHIHDGAATVNGPVTINTGLSGIASVTTDTGSGNIYRTVTVDTPAGIATLNAIALNPENAYVNMHTTVNPGGVVRSQLAPANTTPPSIGAVTSNPDSKTVSVSPGEIITIYGLNLAKYQSDLSGTYNLKTLPTTLNGVTVTIGGRAAPLYFVSPFQINAQVPVDVPTGQQPVVVTTPNGTSTAFVAQVFVASPVIYVDFSSNTAAILRNSDYTLVTKDNPATAGDLLLVYLTGLGQTTPPLQTGSVEVGSTLNNTGTVTATIGGVNAPVVYSIASPGFAGLYQVAVTVPAGVTGNAALVLKVGQATSNTVNIPVK